MGTARVNFRIGYEQAMLKKVYKSIWGIKSFRKADPQKRAFLNDCKHFPEELIDFLLEYKQLTIEDVVKAVNDWLHLESKMTNYPRRKYIPGNAENLFSIIRSQRVVHLAVTGSHPEEKIKKNK
jgi:hypothetical protein